jgi:hypothetical protein
LPSIAFAWRLHLGLVQFFAVVCSSDADPANPLRESEFDKFAGFLRVERASFDMPLFGSANPYDALADQSFPGFVLLSISAMRFLLDICAGSFAKYKSGAAFHRLPVKPKEVEALRTSVAGLPFAGLVEPVQMDHILRVVYAPPPSQPPSRKRPLTSESDEFGPDAFFDMRERAPKRTHGTASATSQPQGQSRYGEDEADDVDDDDGDRDWGQGEGSTERELGNPRTLQDIFRNFGQQYVCPFAVT